MYYLLSLRVYVLYTITPSNSHWGNSRKACMKRLKNISEAREVGQNPENGDRLCLPS